MKERVLVLDILDHPTFSFREDYVEVLERAARPSTEVVVLEPIADGGFADLDPADYIGVIVSGSFTSYSTPVPWMGELRAFIERARDYGRIPLLGVCMVHELMADMYGGEVALHPDGSELGTRQFHLTDEGRKSPLFAGFPPTFAMQSAHRHDVVRVPRETTVLAFNDRCPYQAFRYQNLFGVQFHVDVPADTLRGWIRTNLDADALISQGRIQRREDYEPWLDHIHDTPERQLFFANFVNLCYSWRKPSDH
jgi:GMP synthase (glutamine-hydrolysing)